MKKFLALIQLVLVMLCTVNFCEVYADGGKYAYVTAENLVYPVSAGAKWEGRLLDCFKVQIYEGEKVTDVISRAFDMSGVSVSGVEENYITEIGGVEAMEYSIYSGWMITINDWFINYGAGEFYVKENDVISFVYTNDFGADVGSDWGNMSTLIKSADFSHGILDKKFDKNVYSYDLIIPMYTDKIKISLVLENKNYQARIYKNAQVDCEDGIYSVRGEREYENIISGLEIGDVPPELGLCHKNSYISVSDGDVISVCCGLNYYNSMNSSSGGSLYTFNIKKAYSDCLIEKETDDTKISVKPLSLNGENFRLIFAEYDDNRLLSLKSSIITSYQVQSGYSVDYGGFLSQDTKDVYVYLVNQNFMPVSQKLRLK